jgi:(1->4)-alpha-D-glucan 1-alpha-D-glucosylmutase
LDPAAFHQANISRLQREPAAMLTTSTHDTKMSEDARARVAAISELLEPWEKFVLNATAANRKFKTRVGQALAPARNDEYRFYQVLLATWPLEKMTAQNRKFYTSRLQEHMIKCLREAKTYTSWDHQNPACEKAMTSFVDDVINRPPAGFVNYFAPLAETIAELGAINSLSQTLLKLMVPGVPDIYQGNELWQFILTDPDNRRPIDFAIRRNLLASLKKHTVSALLQDWRSGALKLFLTKTVLNFRRTYPLLFQMGDYLPLKCQGEFENHCIAFARADGKRTIVVLVPRLTTPLGFPPIGECWASTFVNLAPLGKRTFVNLFTRAPVGSDRPKLSEIFRELPFAALTAV